MQQNKDILNLRNIIVIISYDGSHYHGWQIQKNAVTVQEVFQKALEKIMHQKLDIKGCSRTDTGVHANMYAISFKVLSRMKCENIVSALNRFLPPDMAAIKSYEVPLDFHARYSCVGKEYIYKIWNNKIRNPFLNNRVFHYWYPLDEKYLNDAAKMFIGKHNFTAFATLDKRETKNMVRNITEFEVYRNGDMVEFKVRADGFLYNMVRIMSGTLLRVAQGKIKPEDIHLIIKSQDRKNAGPTAPPQGLYLNKVFYE